jgi:hypothetical protein
MTQRNYDADEYIVPARDLNGRSVRLCLRVPPLLDRMLKELVKSGKSPFKEKADAARWCINHGVETLESLIPSASIFPVLRMSLLLTRANIHRNAFNEFFVKLDGVMVQLSAHSYLYERSRRLINAIEELILCMPSSHHRCLYHGELRQRWGHFLGGSESARATHAADGEQAGETRRSDDRR